MRKALSPEARKKHDEAITKRLFELKEFQQADKVLFYASYNSEVNTELMIVESLEMGKTVLLPKVDTCNNCLTKHIITGLHELTPGHMGIPEPVTDNQMKVEDIHMLVIPGLAFDINGLRLGYGGGFYDKILHRIKNDRTIAALAFELQIVDSVPGESHDIPVDYILTEERTISCNG